METKKPGLGLETWWSQLAFSRPCSPEVGGGDKSAWGGGGESREEVKAARTEDSPGAEKRAGAGRDGVKE